MTLENHTWLARPETRPAETKRARYSYLDVERGRTSDVSRYRNVAVVNE